MNAGSKRTNRRGGPNEKVTSYLHPGSHLGGQSPCPNTLLRGKTVRIVTGFPAGDVNDAWPRLIGQYMTKYIPGNPAFIVQNMPGAGSMIAANHVYGVAKPDGLTLGWTSFSVL